MNDMLDSLAEKYRSNMHLLFPKGRLPKTMAISTLSGHSSTVLYLDLPSERYQARTSILRKWSPSVVATFVES